MKHPKPQYEQMEIPRIRQDIKEMNGRSTKKLNECIDDLAELLDANDKETIEKPSIVRDTNTE